MAEKFNNILDRLSEFLAHRKGLLPMLGILMVAANAVLQFLPASGWLGESNLLLHLGIILSILGILLAWAL
jgi:hypothetical protein